MPAHPVALALIAEAGCLSPRPAPIASRNSRRRRPSTCASRSEAPLRWFSTAAHAGSAWSPPCCRSAAREPVLLRPGMISQAEIEELIGPIALPTATAGGAHPSPGMHAQHYSPRTPLLLVSAAGLPERGEGVFLYRSTPSPRAHSVLMPAAPQDYAAALYSTLHEADAQGWDWIAVESPPSDAAWMAIRDRLTRAAR